MLPEFQILNKESMKGFQKLRVVIWASSHELGYIYSHCYSALKVCVSCQSKWQR